MKTAKITIDLRHRPQIVELLRIEAAQQGTTQRAIVAAALEAYFGHRLENHLLAKAAESAFRDWDNEEDKVYDDL